MFEALMVLCKVTMAAPNSGFVGAVWAVFVVFVSGLDALKAVAYETGPAGAGRDIGC